MAGSSAEKEVRDAVVSHIHTHMPTARVIHELACGGNRADLAAVDISQLLLFEIKSSRDVLTRTAAQMATFRQSAHAAVLVADVKWFDREPYNNGSPRLAWPEHRDYRTSVWCYPEKAVEGYPTASSYRWNLPRPTLVQPHARLMLDLLLKAELIEECRHHNISVPPRARCLDIINQMVWLMTGREICQAVCRQLRQRTFAEADAPRAAA